MKKVIAITSAFILSCSAMCITAVSAESESNDSASVYFTIADKDGKLVAIQEKVEVTDINNDGELTLDDAFYCAHETLYEGGAEAGYKSSIGSYGLMIDKLWGTENGGGYGFAVNNIMSNGLGDPVADGDYVDGFVYTDLLKWSDFYCWFNIRNGEAKQGDELELTLKKPVYGNDGVGEGPVEGATITVNGEKTEYVTDAEGKVTIKLDEAGEDILISATSDTETLVPPALLMNVEADEDVTTTTTTTTTTSTTTTTTTTSTKTKKATTTSNSPKTGDSGLGSVAVIFGASVAAAFAFRRKEND
ncbi:MAG: hypothetical protein II729_00310 [Ruminococcus sp.]|nr:hypothetical protein [Ruminococcus sp.]